MLLKDGESEDRHQGQGQSRGSPPAPTDGVSVWAQRSIVSWVLKVCP